MSLKFGDSVVLVQKSSDGKIRRTNAIVLASVVQPSNVDPRQALRDHRGILPAGEYLDVIFPRQFPNGNPPKSSDLDVLFQRAVQVGQWKADAWIGWEPVKSPADAEALKLKTFLMTKFKDETGDETPVDCAIRLLSKKK